VQVTVSFFFFGGSFEVAVLVVGQLRPFQALEDGLYTWIARLRGSNVIVTEEMNKLKANAVAKHVVEQYKDSDEATKKNLHLKALASFRVSTGWYSKFAEKYSLRYGKLSGEAAAAPIEIAQEGQEDLQKILAEYDPGMIDQSLCVLVLLDILVSLLSFSAVLEDIWNLDEAALFWQLLPDSSVMVQENEHGARRVKSRVTVLFMANMTGKQKLRLTVVGKAKWPRCFGKRKPSSLPCDYEHTKKGWMTGDLFTALLKKFDHLIGAKGRKVVLLVDNAGSFLSISFSLSVISFDILLF
jgi:hypothetical protein